MEPISIELTVNSGKDLRAFNFFQKLAIYATVWIGDSKKKHKTQPDRENGSNPEWKHALKLDLDRNSLLEQSLQFHLHTDWVFGDRIIGEVHVPIKDLIGDFNGGLRFVSYQVKDPNGKPNGTLNFSYKINNWNVSKDNEGVVLAGLSGTGDVSFPANPVVDFPSFYPSIENTQEIFSSPVLTQTSYPPATAGYPPPASYPPPPEPYYCHPPPPHCHHPPPPPPHEYFPPPPVGYFPPPPPPPGPPGPYGYMQPGYPYPQFGH